MKSIYFPAGHSVQTADDAVAYEPGKHFIRSAKVSLDGQANPARHSVHEVAMPKL